VCVGKRVSLFDRTEWDGSVCKALSSSTTPPVGGAKRAGVHAAQQVQIWSPSGVALAVSGLGPAGHAACKVMRVTIEFALKPGCCCMHCVQHYS